MANYTRLLVTLGTSCTFLIRLLIVSMHWSEWSAFHTCYELRSLIGVKKRTEDKKPFSHHQQPRRRHHHHHSILFIIIIAIIIIIIIMVIMTFKILNTVVIIIIIIIISLSSISKNVIFGVLNYHYRYIFEDFTS